MKERDIIRVAIIGTPDLKYYMKNIRRDFRRKNKYNSVVKFIVRTIEVTNDTNINILYKYDHVIFCNPDGNFCNEYKRLNINKRYIYFTNISKMNDTENMCIIKDKYWLMRYSIKNHIWYGIFIPEEVYPIRKFYY